MSIKFGVALPQGTLMELAGINDPLEAYETMTQVALTAEETGFDSLWLSDAFWPDDSAQFLFECWTTTAALARDTTRVRIGQMVTCLVILPPLHTSLRCSNSIARPLDATMRASGARPSRSVSSPIPTSRPRPSCLKP